MVATATETKLDAIHADIGALSNGLGVMNERVAGVLRRLETQGRALNGNGQPGLISKQATMRAEMDACPAKKRNWLGIITTVCAVAALLISCIGMFAMADSMARAESSAIRDLAELAAQSTAKEKP